MDGTLYVMYFAARASSTLRGLVMPDVTMDDPTVKRKEQPGHSTEMALEFSTCHYSGYGSRQNEATDERNLPACLASYVWLMHSCWKIHVLSCTTTGPTTKTTHPPYHYYPVSGQHYEQLDWRMQPWLQ